MISVGSLSPEGREEGAKGINYAHLVYLSKPLSHLCPPYPQEKDPVRGKRREARRASNTWNKTSEMGKAPLHPPNTHMLLRWGKD